VLLGVGNAQLFYGNGNFVVNGQVTGFEQSADRLIKTGNILATTLWLKNDSNDFLQAVRVDSGTVRVSTNAALGRNTSTQAVDLNNGFLEVHTDTPGIGLADFSTRKVFNRDNTNTGIFVNRGLGGTAINQTVTFGETRATGTNTNFRITGRNGFNVTLTGAGNSPTGNMGAGGTNNALIENNSSGLLTLATGSLWNQTDTTARRLTIQGNGDTVVTGNITASGAAHSFSKGGSGTLIWQATASTYTGDTTINGGTLSVGNLGAFAGTSQINIGNATTTPGALTYTGPAATLSKLINFNTTTANVYINASGSGALTIDGTLAAVTGNKTLLLGGTSTAANLISSAIPAAGGTLNLQKVGIGTWVLSGANAFTGSTTVSNGALRVQDTFSGSSRDVLPNAGAIVFGVDTLTNTAGGTFEYLGAAGSTSAETVGALTPTAGAGVITADGGRGRHGRADLCLIGHGLRWQRSQLYSRCRWQC